MREIIVIVAAAENNALGKDNQLVWHLPKDFKRFKALTTGHFIIMGRKTFESLPKPLPNRTHVIITRQKNYTAPENCIVVNTIADAINACPKNDTIFIIGGGEIYKQALPLATKIELTRVHTTVIADTFFPEINTKQWELITAQHHEKDKKHAFCFSFLTYIKK